MASLGGGKSAQTPPPAYYSTAGGGGTLPPNSIQMVAVGGGGVGIGRRQISEPADTSNLSVQFVPTDQVWKDNIYIMSTYTTAKIYQLSSSPDQISFLFQTSIAMFCV